MEASSGVEVIRTEDRYEIVPYKMMGQTAYSIRDKQRGRFVAGANTAYIAEIKCRKLNTEDRRNAR